MVLAYGSFEMAGERSFKRRYSGKDRTYLVHCVMQLLVYHNGAEKLMLTATIDKFNLSQTTLQVTLPEHMHREEQAHLIFLLDEHMYDNVLDQLWDESQFRLMATMVLQNGIEYAEFKKVGKGV